MAIACLLSLRLVLAVCLVVQVFLSSFCSGHRSSRLLATVLWVAECCRLSDVLTLCRVDNVSCRAVLCHAVLAQAEGLSALPASDLGGIIARIAASRMAKGSQQSTTPQLQRSPPVTPVAAAEAAAGVEGGDLKSLPAIVQEAMPQAWKALASCAGKMVDMFQPVAFVENKETDTQVGVRTV